VTTVPAHDLVRDAERILYQAKWRIREERVSERLFGTHGLHWTRLFPESPVIRIVAVDGRVVGRIRRSGRRWALVRSSESRPAMERRTFRGALRALARDTGGARPPWWWPGSREVPGRA
jgi:hypothetical protein